MVYTDLREFLEDAPAQNSHLATYRLKKRALFFMEEKFILHDIHKIAPLLHPEVRSLTNLVDFQGRQEIFKLTRQMIEARFGQLNDNVEVKS